MTVGSGSKWHIHVETRRLLPLIFEQRAALPQLLSSVRKHTLLALAYSEWHRSDIPESAFAKGLACVPDQSRASRGSGL